MINNPESVRDRFHDTLVDGMRHAIAVLKEAKPGISVIELAVCLADEFDEFLCDLEDTLDAAVNDETISSLTDAEITALASGINGVLGLTDDDEDPYGDATTFSYENALKYTKQDIERIMGWEPDQGPTYMAHLMLKREYGRCAETEPGGGGIVTAYTACNPTTYMDEIDAKKVIESLAKLTERAPRVVMPVLRDVEPVSLTDALGKMDIYCPEIPLTRSGTVIDPETFDPVNVGTFITSTTPWTNTTGWEDRKMETPRLEITKTTVEAKCRKLSNRWTKEMIQDAGITVVDIEEELLAVLAEEINREAEAGCDRAKAVVDSLPPVNFLTRYGYVDIETPEMPKLRRVEMSPVALMPGDIAARADHTHPAPANIVMTACETPVNPMQCVNRTAREKSSIEVRAVSFR